VPAAKLYVSVRNSNLKRLQSLKHGTAVRKQIPTSRTIFALAADFSRIHFFIHNHAQYSVRGVVTLELHLRGSFALVVESTVKYTTSTI